MSVRTTATWHVAEPKEGGKEWVTFERPAGTGFSFTPSAFGEWANYNICG